MPSSSKLPKRFTCDPGAVIPFCCYCKHIYPEGMKCTAYPNGIPRKLLLRGEHDTPYPDDNGIRFEPKDDNV